jgi:hypothetical protein
MSHKDIQSTEVFPSGYIRYRNDRNTDAHGGVFILVSVCNHGMQKSYCDIDVTWKDIHMDINIYMKASYFGFSDFTVKCIQSEKKIFACRSNVLLKLICLLLDINNKNTNK